MADEFLPDDELADELIEAEHKLTAEEMEQLQAKGWRSALLGEIEHLTKSENLSYLARKASILVQKEQREMGNTSYVSAFTDPDIFK